MTTAINNRKWAHFQNHHCTRAVAAAAAATGTAEKDISPVLIVFRMMMFCFALVSGIKGRMRLLVGKPYLESFCCHNCQWWRDAGKSCRSCVHFAVIAGEVHGLIVPCVRRFGCWRKVRQLRTSRVVHRRLLSAAGALKATSSASSGHLGQKDTCVYNDDPVDRWCLRV